MQRLAILLTVLLSTTGAAAAACPETRPDGGFAADLILPALDRAERQVVAERFAADFTEAARLGVAADALFGFARCDLNASPPAELIVVGKSGAHCVGPGPGAVPICGLWILARAADGWTQVLETAGTGRPARSVSRGWRDGVVERGGPPIAFKFDGVGYREDVDGATPLPFALDDWGAFGDDLARVDWYAFDDPMPPEAEAAFLWFYRERHQGRRVGALPDAFLIGAADLDDSGAREVIVQGISPEFCPPEGCRHWLLRGPEAPGGPAVIGELTGFDLRVARTGGPGGRDLVLSEPEGLAVWRNDGDGWRRRAATAGE